jgi:hypothetical protein
MSRCVGVAVALLGMTFFLLRVEGSDSKSNENAVTLQGRIVSLPGGKTNLLFKTDQGPVYKLLRTPQSEALFVDTNLHAKVLLLKGKLLPEKTFEVTGNFRSIKNGKVHELYYYCDICSIASNTPGPCQCCREPVKLREEPAK